MNDPGHLSISEILQLHRGETLSSGRAEHTAGCARCSREADAAGRWAAVTGVHLSTAVREPSGEGCPSADQLALFAAGLIEPLDPALLAHVAECAHCGPVLRAALQNEPEGDVAPERASTECVQSTAALLSERFKGRPPREAVSIHSRSLRFYLPLAASVVIALCAVLWLVNARLLNTSPERLLAQAYTASRPFEFRLPDAGYSTVHQRRGAGSSFDRPPSLLDAEVEIHHGLGAHPDDPQLARLAAEVNLLKGRYDLAIHSLEHIRPARAADVSELACGYALRGAREHRSADLDRAVQLFRQSLQMDAQQPLTVFNLALTYETMSLASQAADTWRKYLAIDPNSGWANEAREHLRRLAKRPPA